MSTLTEVDKAEIVKCMMDDISELTEERVTLIGELRKMYSEFKNCKRYKSSDGICCACSDRFFKFISEHKII